MTESLRVQTQQYSDLKEKSQIYYRRLVAVGETAGLDGTAAVHVPLAGGVAPGNNNKSNNDDDAIVGSPVTPSASPRRSLAAGAGGAGAALAQPESLTAELDDFNRGAVAAQAAEIEGLKRQLAAVSATAAQREREVERLHAELEASHGGSAETRIGVGPSSDGEEPKAKCCGACSIM